MNTTAKTPQDLLKTGRLTRKTYYFAINEKMQCTECEKEKRANKFKKTPDNCLPDYCDQCLEKHPQLLQEAMKLWQN